MPTVSTHTIRLAFLGAFQDRREGSWNDVVRRHTALVFPSRGRRKAIAHLRTTLSACDGDPRLDLRMVGYSWGAWTALQLADTILKRPTRIHHRLGDMHVQISLGLLDPVGTLRARAPLHPSIRAWNIFQQNGCYRGCPGHSGWFAGRPIEGALENRDVTLEGRALPARDDVPPASAPDHIQLGYRGWGGHDRYIASVLEHGWAGPKAPPSDQ